MKKLFFVCLSLCLLNSCSEADLNETTETTTIFKSTPRNDNYLLKKKFAIALHKAMTENPAVRAFLKTEALKQFDGDYDVLYGYVSDKLINGTSFRDILLSYFSNQAELEEIETTLPALTIFIPKLPEGSFSAETWDTSSEIPLVAIRLLDNSKTPVISSNSQSYLLDDDVIPGFPVVVLKECERITVPSFPFYNDKKTPEYITGRGFRFRFNPPIFDFIGPRNPPSPPELDPNRLVAAWETYGKWDNLGWHRDYIYYTINPGNPNGPFINNYDEYMKNFKIEGSTPLNALQNIADQSSVPNNLDDPTLDDIISSPGGISQGSFWTDGKFDFNVYIDYHATDPTLEKAFDAAPEDLFHLEYEQPLSPLPIYVATNISQKNFPLNLEILDWRLHDFSNEWRFRVEEQDLQVELTQQDSKTSKYNTNFSVETDIWKIGAKLGGSIENTVVHNISKKYTEQSDDLKQTMIHFGDNIIIDEHEHGSIFFNHTHYVLRRYSTGKCSFSLVPVKVQ